MENKQFIIYTAIVLGIVFILIGAVRELRKPVDWEALRFQECEVELGGTEHERLCNEMYYEISEIRD